MGDDLHAARTERPRTRPRREIRATTAARKALNQKAACRRLEMLLSANFTPRDFHLILTYSPGDLPATRKEAVKRLRKFLRSCAPTARRAACR